MTDQTPPPPPDPQPQGGGGSSSGGGGGGGIDFSALSQGEKFVGIGALAVLAVYIIFELITEDYSVAYMGIMLSVFLLGVVWFKLQRPDTTWTVPPASLMRVAAYLLLVWGVAVFVENVKNHIFDADGTTIVAALILWAGCVVAGYGAKQLD